VYQVTLPSAFAAISSALSNSAVAGDGLAGDAAAGLAAGDAANGEAAGDAAAAAPTTGLAAGLAAAGALAGVLSAGFGAGVRGAEQPSSPISARLSNVRTIGALVSMLTPPPTHTNFGVQSLSAGNRCRRSLLERNYVRSRM